jgi:hypothetical protein
MEEPPSYDPAILNRDSDSHQHQAVCKREVRGPGPRIAWALGPNTGNRPPVPPRAGRSGANATAPRTFV